MTNALLITENGWRPNRGEKCETITKKKPRDNSLWPWIGYVDDLYMHVSSQQFTSPLIAAVSIGMYPVSYGSVFNTDNQQFVAGQGSNFFGGSRQ